MTNYPDRHEILREFDERLDTLGQAEFNAIKALEAYAGFVAAQQQNDELFPNKTEASIAKEHKTAQIGLVAGEAAVGNETSDNPITRAERLVDKAYREAA